jgi:hypothetical protein
MTVVQTLLPEFEHELLRKRARAEHRPIQDVVREAIRRHVIAEMVDPNEPTFRTFPHGRPTRGRDRTSERVDEVLDGTGG